MRVWIRNLIFLIFCVAAVVLIHDRLLKLRPFSAPGRFDPGRYEAEDFRDVVEQVNDAFGKEWEKAGIVPVDAAPDLLVARRLSLALTGTIPSLEEIRALEAQPEACRVQWWLSHLFEDRRYGDYLAERFARMYVGVENGPFLVYRRHRMVSWLSDQIQANRPYDQLVRQVIASEGIWTTQPEVNFVTVTVDQNDEEKGPDEVKLAARVTRAFLGVRIDCVQCHDDMFSDRWKQKDFHQLAAFFSGAEMSLTGVRDQMKPYEFRFKGRSEAEVVPPVVPFQSELLPAGGPLRERLAEWVTHPKNRAFARVTVNRIWALLFNRPLVAPIDDIPLDGPLPPGMEILADDLVAHGFDLQRLVRIIAATRAFQLDGRARETTHGLTKAHEKNYACFPLTRLRPEQVAASVIQASSLKTIDADSHVLFRIARFLQEGEFIKRYGDFGENEFVARGETIPQRLILMNGKLVRERTENNLVMNAATRIGALAPDDSSAVEAAYLAVLSRRPSPEEQKHFAAELKETQGDARAARMQDLYWALINSTEFSWNH